jgi:4-diphosphocytidyl-2-C-methyl-D-erythritol kinase
MVVFPNAKINLGLRVTSKRDDGYHNLDTVFYPIPIHDALDVIINKKRDGTPITFTQSGKLIKGDQQSNLCVKAIELIRLDFPDLPDLLVHLHKNIPMGAGMGGGSSDGAFMISLINDQFKLGIDDSRQKAYALRLGSDCPFFIDNKPVYATGRGELMKSISCNLSNTSMLFISPGIHISTREAFNNIKLSPTAPSCEQIVQQPIETWKESLENDFEKTVFPQHPELGAIKNKLYSMGALYASMTGSGSTLYGIFESSPDTSIFRNSRYEIGLIENGKHKKIGIN